MKKGKAANTMTEWKRTKINEGSRHWQVTSSAAKMIKRRPNPPRNNDRGAACLFIG